MILFYLSRDSSIIYECTGLLLMVVMKSGKMYSFPNTINCPNLVSKTQNWMKDVAAHFHRPMSKSSGHFIKKLDFLWCVGRTNCLSICFSPSKAPFHYFLETYDRNRRRLFIWIYSPPLPSNWWCVNDKNWRFYVIELRQKIQGRKISSVSDSGFARQCRRWGAFTAAWKSCSSFLEKSRFGLGCVSENSQFHYVQEQSFVRCCVLSFTVDDIQHCESGGFTRVHFVRARYLYA